MKDLKSNIFCEIVVEIVSCKSSTRGFVVGFRVGKGFTQSFLARVGSGNESFGSGFRVPVPALVFKYEHRVKHKLKHRVKHRVILGL